MSTSQHPTMYAIAILMVTLAIASCGSVHTTNGYIVIKKEPSSIARFLNVTVESAESGTLITGTLERKKSASRRKIPGHIDVSILTKDEEVLTEVKAELERVSHQPRQAIFNVVMDQEVPSNGMVLVKHHRSDRHE